MSLLSNFRRQVARIPLARRLYRTLFSAPKPVIVPSRFGLTTESDALEFLVGRAAELSAHAGKTGVLVVSSGPRSSSSLDAGLRGRGLQARRAELTALPDSSGDVACVVCADFDSRSVMQIARALMSSEVWREIPFEYAVVVERDYGTLIKYDQPDYTAGYFKAPALVDEVDIFCIYEESLRRFDLKCDVRDFMEVFQSVRYVVKAGIPGNIAEFGSYKGHSGYLIARLLESLRSEKHLYLFDMFETFPEEPLGVDRFWTGTHEVNFEEVRAKFADRKHVSLVKGEFTQTVPRQNLGPLAFAFIDCDSYRAIKYLIRTVYPLISVGGVMVFEDYGAPALLGARMAVDEYFADRPGCFTFFSQFTGFYTVVKMTADKREEP